MQMSTAALLPRHSSACAAAALYVQSSRSSHNGRQTTAASSAACRLPAAIFSPQLHHVGSRHLHTLRPLAAAVAAAPAEDGVRQGAAATAESAALQQGGLVVVESPAKARKIQQYLGNSFTVSI